MNVNYGRAAALVFLFCATLTARQGMAQGSFLPSWKLMNAQEKQHFIAGYVQGWRDAQQVTDITISYVKKNPANAVSGLEKMRSLYDLSGAKPELLARAIDVFYMDPANGNASLSSAVTAARNALNSSAE